MKKGNEAIWMIVIFGVLAIVVLALLIGISVSGVGKGKEGFNKGFDVVTQDKDCDGIPDQMDTVDDGTSACSRNTNNAN